MGDLAQGVLKKDKKAVAKLMRYIENEDIRAVSELQTLYKHAGNSYVIGITGLPGSGKSTLVDSLIELYRVNNKSVGVIAIDPSSPFTGGSFLGDRIRMKDHSLNGEVFIKSLPTRGWHGGISKVTSRMITVLDAMGKDIILIETAGVGQTEVDIKNLVHTTLVVLVGGLGDHIQVIKAGIIEIADIFIINKSKDSIPAKDLEFDLKNLFSLNGDPGTEKSSWVPAIILTEATENMGIEDMCMAISRHKDYLIRTGNYDCYFKENHDIDLKQFISDYLIEIVKDKIKDENFYEKIFEKMKAEGSDHKKIIENALKEVFRSKDK